jgi:hypothetical protein
MNQESASVLAGWAAITAAVLTETGLVTLLVFFGTGLPLLGALSDLNTVAMALVTVPVALALYPVAARGPSALAAIALGADFIGVALAAVFSLALVVGVVTFEGSLLPVTLGNGLIGIWLLLTAGLLLAGSALPAALGWLGVAGGAGLAVSALAFPALGREHPIIAIAGLTALIGLVGFYAWMGVLLLYGRVRPLPARPRH